uniref:Casein kinase I n=1 Tax=Alexandrium monilatum TaxID=311494 RepID=A0A7S4VLA4_9DINO
MVRSGAKPAKVLLDGEYLDKSPGYRIDVEIARGNTGAAVYRAERAGFEDVAVKYPVTHSELGALKAIRSRSPDCPGVLQMTSSGTYNGGLYVVMPMLGPCLSKLFERLLDMPPADRWTVVSTVGRMLLRSLEGIHRCGIVHCDVQPNNILVGKVNDARAKKNAPFRPFFIDFGCARSFPGGLPMDGRWGSLDFNSIRSAGGGERDPHDDLESLGWVLCHAFAGELPWFPFTVHAWEVGMWKGEAVDAACREVQQAKLQVRCRGWSSFGPSWAHLEDIPEQLSEYLRTCWTCPRGRAPDYAVLAELLGAPAGRDAEDMEEADLAFFNEEVVPLLDLADLSLM